VVVGGVSAGAGGVWAGAGVSTGAGWGDGAGEAGSAGGGCGRVSLTAANFLWVIRAAMHSPAAIVASQKGQKNPVDMVMLTGLPPVNDPGGVTVVDPLNGMLKPANDCRSRENAKTGITNKTTMYNGFLYAKPSNCLEYGFVGSAE